MFKLGQTLLKYIYSQTICGHFGLLKVMARATITEEETETICLDSRDPITSSRNFEYRYVTATFGL